MRKNLLVLAISLHTAFSGTAAVPAPERLLPGDTLFMVTIPDFNRGREFYNNSPQGRYWRDPALKPFKDHFLTKLNEEIVTPLERELGIRVEDYKGLAQGQVTLAVIPSGEQPGTVLLVDARDKSDQLAKNLSSLKTKWVEGGNMVRTEKIRDVDFTALQTTGEKVASILKDAFPGPKPRGEGFEEPPDPEAAKKKSELLVGQSGSLLIAGTSAEAIEKILARLAGGAVAALGDRSDYNANHAALFRGAPVYGWADAKAFVEKHSRGTPDEAVDGEPAFPPRISGDKVLRALGLNGLNTAAFSLRELQGGMLFNIFVGVPTPERQGLFKILAADAKDSAPPPFVPANAVKFQRWRMDAQQAWVTLEKMISEISPQMLGGINFLLETASAAARLQDPQFDLKKQFLGNLGDDLISYQKAPRGHSVEEMNEPPSLFLISSANPDQLAAALKTLTGFLAPTGAGNNDREFLGRKIYTVTLPPMPTPDGQLAAGRSLHFAASGGYLSVSRDVALLEEYLRSNETEAKALRDLPGFLEAVGAIGGTATGLIGYTDQREPTRALLEAAKKDATVATKLPAFSPLAGPLGATRDEARFRAWFDVTLLPEFEKIAKYFHFTVYTGTTTPDGLIFKVFTPLPPELRP